ncbi:MAG: alpha/beta hydrolase [Desulfobulbaceae bacterium]|nr:alpha/beta hydrolase [Desulfobulbaceae bacterium]
MRSLLVLLFLMLSTTPSNSQPADSGQVVLLHGLARTSRSMARLEKYLSVRGYRVVNIDYPSRKHRIDELAKMVRKEVVAKTRNGEKVHFITHSMGGIILCSIQQNDPLPNLGRVVMLSPPNQGSEVVDVLGNLSLFRFTNGPAGREIGTDEQSIPQQLGKIDFELGVITGDRSINWINSLLIPGKDDGKVSIESAKIEGMADFRVVHVSHPFIMKDEKVMNECLHFLRNGFFSRETKPSGRPFSSLSI